MKNLAVGACALIAFATVAHAQDVVVTPEDQTIVRDYATTEHWRSVEPPAGFEVREGVDVPASVELREVPKLPRYRAAVIGQRTVIVEPKTRRVIRVLQ